MAPPLPTKSFNLAGQVLIFVLLPAAAAGGALALPALVCLAGLFALHPSLIAAARRNSLVLSSLAAILLWAVAASSWSPEGAAQAGKLALIAPLACAFLAGAGRAGKTSWALAAAAFAVLFALLALEAVFDLPLNRAIRPDGTLGDILQKPTRGAVVLLGMAFGVSAGFVALRRPVLAIAALTAAGFMSLQFGMDANSAAFLLGVAAFAVALAAPRLTLAAASSVLALWMLLSPFLTPLCLRLVDAGTIPTSWAHRLGIWDFTAARITEQPLFGHGLDAARAVSAQIDVNGQQLSAIPMHPHSASLQIWYELGAVGAVLAAVFIALCGWRLGRTLQATPAAAAAATAILAAYGLIANVSFGVWQEWWIASMVIAAGAAAAVHTMQSANASS